MAAGEALESYHHHSRISVDQQQRKLTAPVDNHEDNIDVVKLENDDFTGEFTTPLRFPCCTTTREISLLERRAGQLNHYFPLSTQPAASEMAQL